MNIWGINAMNHDASISVVDSDTGAILFAGHAERYSRIKNDPNLNEGLIADARQFGNPDLVVWYENPFGRKIRNLRSGDFRSFFTWDSPKKYLESHGIHAPLKFSNHHASHAAGSFYTSGFDDAAVLVVDAIGEMSTASIWHAQGNKLTKKWSLNYPHSVGLFYSAITDLVGLKPNEEEYILMGMAAYSNHSYLLTDYVFDTFFKSDQCLKQTFNFHRGVKSDTFLKAVATSEQGRYDLAGMAQEIVETCVQQLVDKAEDLVDSDCLVYSGGVALNCVANEKFQHAYQDIWIMPNPGDAGNSLGAVANYLRKPLKWSGPFLGHEIKKALDVDAIVEELLTAGICGVAHGRAEFGPRAFGNRSLLADPRRPDIKDKVNTIKKRQKFRPFAPAVLSRFANEYFHLDDISKNAKYMQYAVPVKADDLPAITHADGTARVQVATEEADTLKQILEAWYAKTGCPVLLNTSLNIKGEPLVNTWEDATRWQDCYKVKVF